MASAAETVKLPDKTKAGYGAAPLQRLNRLTDKPVFRQRTGLMIAAIDQTRDGDSSVFIQALVGQSAVGGKTHRWFLATVTTTTSRYHRHRPCKINPQCKATTCLNY